MSSEVTENEGHSELALRQMMDAGVVFECGVFLQDHSFCLHDVKIKSTLFSAVNFTNLIFTRTDISIIMGILRGCHPFAASPTVR